MKIKIPIVIWGVGYRHNFGDKSLSKDQLESIILLNKKARLSSVRDQISKEFLKGLGLEVDCIGDPAIFLKGKSTKIVFNTKIKIGINIAYHGWKLQEKYIVQILNFYRNLLNGLEKRYSPQFFYLRHHPNENKIIRKLKREFPKITICDYGPYQMKTIYENLDFVINMMLHSSIFAFSSNTSMINIAYDEKNIAFMKSINKEDRIIDVRKLNSEKIDDIINLMPVLIKKDDNLVKVKEEFKIRIDEFIQKIKLL